MDFPLWLIGVLLAVLASIISNLGLNIQKRCHLNNQRISAETAANTVRQTRKKRKIAVEQQKLLQQQQQQQQRINNNNNNTNTNNNGTNSNISNNNSIIQENGIVLKQDNNSGIIIEQENSISSNSSSNGESPPLINDPNAVKLRVQNKPIKSVNRSRNGTYLAPSPRNRTDSVSSDSGRGRTETFLQAQQEIEDSQPKVNYTKQRLWQFGIFLVFAGSLFDFAALAFTDQSIVAPLGSLTLVCNAIFAPLLLKEKVSLKVVLCTIIIVAGSALAVVFASHEDSVITVDEMFQLFINYRFIAYCCVTFGSIIVMRVLVWRYGKLRKLNARSPEYAKVQPYHKFCYAACAGIMGAQSVLFAKCTAQLLVSTIAGEGMMFTEPGTYGVLLGLVITIYYQVRWLNSGLRLFPALYIVPVFQTFWILVSVMSGILRDVSFTKMTHKDCK